MAKKVQLMTNAKEWQTVNGVEVLIDIPQEDLDPITDSSCVEIEGHRTLEETISQENMFTPEIVETKVHSKVGGVYHDNVVDGAYEEAILYGNTQVNLVESMTSDTKYIPHSFTSFQGNESKIGNYNSGRTNQVAPLVKGVTMVNLCQESSMTLMGGGAASPIYIKGDTKYTLKFTFTQKNSMAGIVIQSYKEENGTLTYLENSKLQSGLGDEVSITFTTHEQANRVHICNGNEYGGETIQLDNIMVIEGDVTDLDLPFFKGMRSVELSRPLTNLFTDDLRTESLMGGTATNSGGTVIATAESIGTWKGMSYFLDNKLKPNTKYLIMWDNLTQTQTSATNTDVIIGVYHHDGDTVTTRLGTINASPLCPVTRSIVFDTGNYDVTQISIRVHATLSNSETGTTTVTGLRVFEWDDSLRSVDLQTIGYFSGTKYVSVRALETEGKNLYPYGDVNFTPTQVQWHDAKGTNYMYGDIAQKSKCRFLLKKGTYKLSSDYNNRTNLGYMALVTDKEETMEDTTFTLEEDTYLTLRLQPVEANVPTTLTNIQIERGETVTTYEAYQSRYYKPRETEEIILRSLPNGVCDTFNLQTGELVQRIHSHVFDGATYELNFMNTPGEVSGDDVVGGWSSLYNMYAPKHNSVSISCDIPTRQRTTSHDADYVNKEFFMVGVNTFIISLSKTRLNGLSIGQYLTRNPITVQYELAEPIITKLQTYARVYSGQTNAPTSMGNNLSALTYYNSNYYVKVGNLSPVPAILEPVTSIPYDVRLKPSTLYTVKYNRGGNSNSMKFDLGGSVVEKTNTTTLDIVPEEFTVKTPAILSHEQLILSGTGFAHNFIVVEGDITGTELPYFEGMKDVKMPIVKNISKNLLNESSMRVFYESNIVLRTYDAFPCKPNTKYCFYSVGGEAYCNWYVCEKDAYYTRPESESKGIIKYLGYAKQITTPNDCYYLCIYTGSNTDSNIDPEVYSIKTSVYEGTIDEQVKYGYTPHRENEICIVQGEYPITSEMIEQGGFSASLASTYEDTKYDSAARLRSKDLIPVKPNTTYAFAHSFSKFAYNVYQWNGNKKFIDGVSQYFNSGQVETITTTADTQYIHFLISKHDASQAITVSEYDWSQFHMYELDSTINLRSLPNGVKDELNLLTGEYIQRVGEKIIDGYETLKVIPQVEIGVYRYENDFITSAASTIATIPQTVVGNYSNSNYNGFYYLTGDGISFIRHDMTLDEFYEYLKSNPITVQYELAQPIISHVRIVSNTQEREVGVKLPNGVCNTYNPSTGITTVRVGFVELNGSEDEKFDSTIDVYNKENTIVFFAYQHTPLAKKHEDKSKGYPIYTNQFEYVDVDLGQTSGGMYMDVEGAYMAFDGNVCFSISKEKLKPFGFTDDMNTKIQVLPIISKYLVQNPLKAWYELKYPQIQPDIVLPNGVHDEYNPETGVYTKRVGFVELDGSEHWVALSTVGYFYTEAHDVVRSSDYTKTMICDGLPIAQTYGMVVSSTYLTAYPNNDLYPNENWIYIIGSSYTTKDELISSLSQNPIKVWYELATPITYQLTPYFGLPQPYAYEDGYLIHDSAYAETTLPPEFKYKLVANRTGQIVQNDRKLQEHTTRLSNLEALIIEATIESLFNRELQLFELELMDIQLIDLGE